MTNLIFLYPDIPFRGIELSAPSGSSPSLNAKNLVTGQRINGFQAASAGTTFNFDYDLGADSDNWAQPDYILLDGAHIIANMDSADVNVTVTGSDADDFSSPESYAGAFGVDDLTGAPVRSIYSNGFSFANPYRYWRVTIETTESIQLRFYKLFLGNFFFFNRDPVVGSRMTTEGDASWRSGKDRLNFKFEGISDAKVLEFQNKLNKYKDFNSVYLVAFGYGSIINSRGIIYYSLDDVRIDPIAINTNSIELLLTESI